MNYFLLALMRRASIAKPMVNIMANATDAVLFVLTFSPVAGSLARLELKPPEPVKPSICQYLIPATVNVVAVTDFPAGMDLVSLLVFVCPSLR